MTRKETLIADVIRDAVNGCTDDGRGDIRARAIADVAVRIAEALKLDTGLETPFLTRCNVDRLSRDGGRGWDRPKEVRSL